MSDNRDRERQRREGGSRQRPAGSPTRGQRNAPRAGVPSGRQSQGQGRDGQHVAASDNGAKRHVAPEQARQPQRRPQQGKQNRRPEDVKHAERAKRPAKAGEHRGNGKQHHEETQKEQSGLNEGIKQIFDTEVTEIQHDTDFLTALMNEEPINTPRLKRNYPEVRRSNIPMILMLFILVVFGLIILYSVSGPQGYAMPNDKSSMYYVKRQLGFTAVGLVMCFTASFIPVKFFNRPIIWSLLYIVSLVSLILTKVAGYSLNGAKRWIKLGGFTFQSSEMVKVALVIALAGYRSWILDQRAKGRLKAKDKRSQIYKDAFFDFILPVGAAMLCDIFIAIQPHMSCTLIVAFVVFMCTLNSGIGIRSWINGGVVIAIFCVVGLVLLFTVNPTYVQKNFAHVFQRFEIFSATHGDESADVTADETRQVDNAHNALGSGGMWGRGLGNSRAKYDYVSEPQNDYIFSIYVEETGFVGGMLLILMYMITFAMCFMVIMRADSVFSRMIATGCTSIIMIQVLMNIAVELQVIPSTGVTLPFVSYGGTAQVFLLVSYGMILCVSRSGTAPRIKKENNTDGV
ncbi:cell division protein FtsW, lipid II flippase [Ruminococcaceae bacterium KH2T8]|nr:cell division protein FtsW, lipid II flippase [Ruminococcaceae bacterium KH2T8]